MRYMIVHLVKDEAKEYLWNLSRVLSSFYRLRPPVANIDPHLTLKSPFDALSTDLFDIERILDRYARSNNPSSYTLNGFGAFDNRVIYMNVEAPDETKKLFQGLKDELKEIPWLDFKPHEDTTTLHSTICYPRIAEQSTILLEKLTKRGGKTFDCTVDSIALMKKGERRWELYKEYKLGNDGVEPLTFTEV